RGGKIRHANRLREQLQRYYPQMLQFDSDLAEEWILKLWEAAPTPAKAARLRQAEVEKLLKRHRIRRIGAAEVLAILKQTALTVAPGVTEAAVAHIRVLIESIRLCVKQLKEAHRQLDRLCKLLAEPIAGEDGKSAPEQEQAQRAVAILQSLPGVGRIVLAVLLAEAFDTLQRADYAILRLLCGVAPVTRRSGKSRAVTRRLACNPRLRNAIHYLADAARRCDETSKAKYLALKAGGCRHARALCTIGDRLLYVACTMLKNRTLFDPGFLVSNCSAADAVFIVISVLTASPANRVRCACAPLRHGFCFRTQKFWGEGCKCKRRSPFRSRCLAGHLPAKSGGSALSAG